MTTARKAYSAYIAMPQPIKRNERTARRIELIKILAARRPSATPNMAHRIEVANRFMAIYGITGVSA